MGTRDPRIDKYIAKSAPFARPILNHIRGIVHKACPDVEETTKWGFPHFMYKGMLCSMASFKMHCAFGFWKSSLVLGKATTPAEEAMGQFGKLTKPDDLPPDTTLITYIKKAMKLNDEGAKVPRAAPKEKKTLRLPADLASALKKSKKAMESFTGFSYSHRKEYIEWLTEAKTPETRANRLETAVNWMAEGKTRNWKYARK